MNKRDAQILMNQHGSTNTPFYFIIDFGMKNCHILSEEEASNQDILFKIENNNNNSHRKKDNPNLMIDKMPKPFEYYQTKFDVVQQHLNLGNSYLVNLTMPTAIKCSSTLYEIFLSANAKYKLLYSDKFVCFSPETFVKIANNKISTFPMKGTIDASIPNSEQLLIENKKEEAEHATIVDLLRNDLSRVASDVKVEKYRYIEKIKSQDKELLQVSSMISGTLHRNYKNKLGDILFSMLPAGSITGAPKPKTVEIIEQTEGYDRGYYTGIAGQFDGENLNSFVIIRFIENQNGQLVYKSGGGITSQSNATDEYQELLDKIYVPVS